MSSLYHSDHLGSANWITDKNGAPVQYLHYLPYGQLLANQQATGSTYDERYKFIGKERDEESGYDYFGARYYISPLLHWSSVDPLVDDYLWISPYAYCGWNPVKIVDPDGRSTHTNEDGLVVAVYDDNDLNIYKHSSAQLESWGDVYTNHLTAEGAEVMGKSLHAMSFADQSKYNNTGEVTHADGMTIDFGSTALGDAIKGVVDSKPSLLEYARNAQGSGEGGGPWNFKANSKYKDHGSQISDGVYLSPRDAGNVLAGAIKRQSGILAPLVQLGYGAYNITNNNKYKGAALSAATLYLIQVCPTLGLPAAAYVMNGEDKLTQLCIDWGYNHYGRK